MNKVDFWEALGRYNRFFVFVHSATLPASQKAKKLLEEAKLPLPLIVVDWHREPEIARRLAYYPPSLVLFDNWKLAHIDIEGFLRKRYENLSQDLIPLTSEKLPPSWANLTEAVVEELKKNLLFFYDPYNAGFGYAPKFLHHEALSAALSLWILDRDIRFRMMVEDTLNIALNRMGKIPYTFCLSPDWSDPSKEITLESISKTALVLFNTAKSIPNDHYSEEATALLERAAQIESLSLRELSIYIQSLATAYEATRRKTYLETALEKVEQIFFNSTYIEDEVEKGMAFLELYFATGERLWLEKAHSQCKLLINEFMDNNAFRDTLLKLPVRYPTRENARACELILKVGFLVQDENLQEQGRECVRKIAKKAVDEGIKGLYLVVPAIIALYGPITVNLYGKDPELQMAAFSLLNPLRVIRYVEASQQKADLCFSNICFPETKDPNQLRDYIVSLLISGK